MSKLSRPSVLAFERRLDVSDAIFWQKNGQNDECSPVEVREKYLKGTKSHELTSLKEAKDANLQQVDVATLDHDKDILVATFSLKVLPVKGEPCVCNDEIYKQKVVEKVQQYINEKAFRELALRYATNIANARWLWRNRMGAEKIKIEVKFGDKTINFDDAKQFSLNDFNQQNSRINEIAEEIRKGLLGDTFIILYITAYAHMGYGQEVYPSQEFVQKDKMDKTSKENEAPKSKVLYRVKQNAGMHSQKVGNALRTIDTWYSDDVLFPIPVEPYGTMTSQACAFRETEDTHFYDLFDKWICKDEQLNDNEQHYVISMLIRGGVFGSTKKKSKGKSS
ncbi:TPA: type I-F CRISPR-associated protein Csy3 [Pasteurella multocida]|nr:type I-F CRISPR-associated protein Csy3 [Pasteurella multocida]HDR1014847.1 type I-F CRISPR-associated protein Csy3 [Pasteurella multocida]HDR1017224.1 type I-F CRISPR-associated protein Csy3 [Pasteurella multocida]HDR1209313.1 type I-F CRISPR-associated protein Csy3 [Pasteurella multocida]HDR1246922.1 type I-F CRISPR-associated protein Csy3 [Pasteurella multocida]